ncbi:DNA (cytosine-5-)-methyltransferase [Alphaproteobacteria bacterium]|nr:DNA (cytosine-5-)-methyltransferase [Alphaproteobacteria bacterium]
MNEISDKNLFSVISTFAGGGGSSIGYKLAGGKVALANEIDPDAVSTYKRNHPKTRMIADDIKNLNDQQIDIDDLDILDGSPPCITFSVARAKKREHEEEGKTENLVLDYVRLALELRPKICVIENVQQFKSAPVFNAAIKGLQDGGYITAHKVLNSVDFGVPQQRKRLFILGIRNDVAVKIGLTKEADLEQLFPTGQGGATTTVKEALDGIAVPPEERDFLLSSMRRSSHYEVLKAIPKNPPKKTRMSMLDKEWQSDFSLDRASWVRPCPTITSLGQQVGQGGICHPAEDRLFTINELSRLMGLPDDYALSGTWNQKAKTIGNMVPPIMMSALAKSLYEKVILPSRRHAGTKYITAKTDYGEKETLRQWKGKFLEEADLDEIVHVTQDTVILRPDPILEGSGVPIAYVITNAFPDNSMREVLYGIQGSSVMRANCAGRIDPLEMAAKGLVEGEHYKLRTPNSYFKRKKNGSWNMIAVANEINSVMIGAKRGRFTGKINISNPDKWVALQDLCFHVEKAFEKAEPEIYARQRKFAEEAIAPEHRHGMITTLSANRYSADQSKAMSVHSDGKDVEYTTMSCHRDGDYEGAYLAFPRWGIGIDLPDNSVCIADSKSLHCVTPIRGDGQRFTTVCYTDLSTATIPPLGKPERLIGRFAKKELEMETL